MISDSKRTLASGMTLTGRQESFFATCETANNLIAKDVILRGASIVSCELQSSNFIGSDLSGSSFRSCNLSDCNLSFTNLNSVDFLSCDLSNANLAKARIKHATFQMCTGLTVKQLKETDDLDAIRHDVFEVLAAAKNEARGLLAAIREGRINGSEYSGECACLIGTVARLRRVDPWKMRVITPQPTRPAERWFLAIRPGDKPEKNPFSALACEWVDEWVHEHVPYQRPR